MGKRERRGGGADDPLGGTGRDGARGTAPLLRRAGAHASDGTEQHASGAIITPTTTSQQQCSVCPVPACSSQLRARLSRATL
eukprot:COSAG01_NODE_9001_length_2586_cov_8.895858_4_plen_82_part_00